MTDNIARVLDLDDQSRVIEAISDPGYDWDSGGNATQAAGWLGNATEADRKRIMAEARIASKAGQVLRISFPSVMTFVLGYLGNGTYGCHVPSDHTDDYCGCCGGEASSPPKGEHGKCCNEQHDVKATEPDEQPQRQALQLNPWPYPDAPGKI